MSDLQFKGPYCDALVKPGNIRWRPDVGVRCIAPAGAGTDHLGVGRCKHHGGCNPIKHGRYSNIKRQSLRDAIEIMESDEDPLNLLPEIFILRALTEDFIARYDDIYEALIEWNHLEMVEAQEDGSRPNIQKVPDLSDAGELLEKITRMVERVHKIKQRGAITLETLNRLLEQFGASVARHVKDPAVLKRIDEDWATIKVD